LLSNHGGRQLDDCISPLDVLADIAKSSSIPVLVDGGFRRGSDLLKAISLGASAVCLGRAALYGLAASGESGVYDVLNLLKNELDQSLAHDGCKSIAEVGPDLLLTV
jgi:(S)-mandelate dehydrogenase